jgi:hypothetical protein
MLIYEHSISGQSTHAMSHADMLKNSGVASGSCLSGRRFSYGCDSTSLPRPGNGGSMVGSETRTGPNGNVKLTDRYYYGEFSMNGFRVEKHGGA